MKVFVIGGVTNRRGTPEFDSEISILKSSSHILGKELAARGHELVLCSPFSDSADYYAAIGSADGQKSTLEFHYPDLDLVKNNLKQLIDNLPSAQVNRMPCAPVGTDKNPDPSTMQYSWLFAQLNALEASAGVIAIGGKSTGSAELLFKLAAARNKSILPLTFLGGAASAYFDLNYWDLYDVLGDRLNAVSEVSQVHRAPALLEELLLGVASHQSANRFFISYARARPQEADYVETLLRRRNSIVYRDEADFEPAADIPAEIVRNIKRSNVFIAIWCKEYACSPWCIDELELVIERQKAGKTELWIFCVDETRMVPRAARTLNYYKVNSREELEGKILYLTNRLQSNSK
jgi:TIR domain